MSGQNVGLNRGMMASFGLWAMGKSANLCSQVKLCNMFMSGVVNKNLNREVIVDMLRGGCYFGHATENI
jgi:hypothetical protein